MSPLQNMGARNLHRLWLQWRCIAVHSEWRPVSKMRRTRIRSRGFWFRCSATSSGTNWSCYTLPQCHWVRYLHLLLLILGVRDPVVDSRRSVYCIPLGVDVRGFSGRLSTSVICSSVIHRRSAILGSRSFVGRGVLLSTIRRNRVARRVGPPGPHTT